jgi:predicted phosphohydrolase
LGRTVPRKGKSGMALYAISDLHLALSIDKPMDVFGNRWAEYMGRLEKNWCSMITDEDHVIVPGDISWATYLDQAYEDFRFIHELPGRKIISKGNHDYWWTTRSKLDKFLGENGFDSISFMHNNSYCVGEM